MADPASTDTRLITVSVRRDIADRAVAKARSEDTTLSQVVRRAIREFLRTPSNG